MEFPKNQKVETKIKVYSGPRGVKRINIKQLAGNKTQNIIDITIEMLLIELIKAKVLS